MHFVLLICFTIVIFNNSIAEDWELRLFEAPDRQTFEEVRDIRVDENGVVWYSSWGNGIARLNGSDWKEFTINDGLSSNYVPAIELDDKGGLWAATENGISYIRPDDTIETLSYLEIPILDEMSMNEVYCLSSGEVWFCTDSGSIIGFCDETSNSQFVNSNSDLIHNHRKWFLVKPPVYLDGDSVYQILEAQDSTIWLAQDSLGIFYLKDQQWIHMQDPLITGRIRSLQEDASGKIWCIAGKLIYFDGQQWNVELEQSGFYVASTPNDTLMFVTDAYVWIHNNQKWEYIQFPKWFGEPKPRVFYMASNKHGWIGTKEGLIEVVQNLFVRKDASTTNTNRMGSQFYASPNEAPLTINDQMQLVRFQDEQWLPVLQFPVESAKQISLSNINQNKIWAKLDSRIFEISLQQNNFILSGEIPNELQVHNLFLSSKNTLYVYGESGIYQFINGNLIPLIEEGGMKESIFEVQESNDGLLILCKKKSVEWWDQDSKVRSWNADQYFSSNFFDTHPFTFAAMSRDNMLWIGTRGLGLLTNKNGILDNVTTADGLISNRIVSFFEDSNGLLWIGNENKGVSSFSNNRWIHYSHEEGIGSEELNGIYEYPKGSIWVTTVTNQIYYFEPANKPPNTFMKLFPETIPYNGFGIMAYEGYDFWNVSTKDQLVYSWRIVDVQNDSDVTGWSKYDIETSTTTPALEPGKYRFEVKSSGFDRVEDESPASAYFTVLPPPVTARPWFIPAVLTAVLFTLALALIAFYSRLQVTAYAVNLESQVYKRTEELSKANQKLIREIEERKQIELQLLQAQKMEAIGKLSGGIAHDFNNILTGLIGYSDILLVELPKNNPNRTYAEAIKKSCKRATDLIKQLLAFSRKQIMQPKVLNINTEIVETKNMLERLIGESIQLELELEDPIKNIKIDPSQLEQILLNLTVNARDAMPHGGSVLFRTQNIHFDQTKQLSTASMSKGSYVMFSVQDSGKGMSPDVQQHIFEPFYSTKGAKGSGLGLSTTYGIVQQSNAFIDVQSYENEGTNFTIYFPVSEQPLTVKETDEFIVQDVPNLNVLVVDDEEVIVHILQQTLQKAGYSVLTAASAEEAYQVFKKMEEKLDLLISDVVLPGLNGKELAELINNSYPVKTIFMSGYTDDIISEHGVLEDEITFIQKPFEPQELVNKIQSIH